MQIYFATQKFVNAFSLILAVPSFFISLDLAENDHCVKSVENVVFSGPYFPVFGLNKDIYGVNLHIQSECGKIRSMK